VEAWKGWEWGRGGKEGGGGRDVIGKWGGEVRGWGKGGYREGERECRGLNWKRMRRSGGGSRRGTGGRWEGET